MTDNARRVESIERFETIAQTTPAAAALRILKGIEKNQPRILIGNDARGADFLQRLRPSSYWAPLARKLERVAKAGKSGVERCAYRERIECGPQLHAD